MFYLLKMCRNYYKHLYCVKHCYKCLLVGRVQNGLKGSKKYGFNILLIYYILTNIVLCTSMAIVCNKNMYKSFVFPICSTLIFCVLHALIVNEK